MNDPSPVRQSPARYEHLSMDPAQQSLAEALKITFRLLQVVMILLVALFLASGFQTVEESERGIKLVFGKVREEDVPPGVTWNWPFPVGELVRVRTGQQGLALDDSFGPKRGEAQRLRPIRSVIGMKPSLEPGVDGTVITADGAIAHTWWQVTWRRDQPALNARNIYSDDEVRLVKAAVERGVVRAVAEMTIDQLLKQGAGFGAAAAAEDNGAAPAQGSPATSTVGESTLALRVRSVAQQTLDAMEAGIRIESVSLDEKAPPGRVFEDFNAVTKSEAQASKQREDAEKAARETLNAVAGEAHTALLELIDDYERAVELGESAAGAEILARIDRIADGEPIVYDGAERRVSGEVTTVIEGARQYRTNTVAQARARVAEFDAKLPQFRERPEVFVATEWISAYAGFRDYGGVEVMFLPPGSPLELWLSRDPSIAEELERVRNEREAEQSIESIDEQRMRDYRRRLREELEKRQAQEAAQ